MLFGLPWESLAGFALTSTLIELTPGPNMVYLAIVALTDGSRRGFAVVAGVALGLAIIGVLAALGMAAVIDASPVLYQTLRWCGVVYLLWLAWDGWRDANQKVESAQTGASFGRYFSRGLITNIFNPKAALFYVAVLPAFVVATHPLMPQTLILSATYVLVATAIHTTIVVLASQLRPFLEDPQVSRIVRRMLAVALALVAVWFAWKTRA
jgi:threonine/homoserine/homoserine lactone efflux protein